jgi:diguanylate cyclase (GGDEF)-like protein
VKILIAEDEAISRRLLEASLAKLGHEVVAVTDGASAVSALLEPDAPRLAILDWMMPGTDGLEVCRRLRTDAPAYVYVILLTAKQFQEEQVAAFEAGVDDFLSKPLDVARLQARLRVGERVLDLQSKLLEIQEVLRHQATHDHLTGLWNRRMILDVLDRELNRASHQGEPIAVALADIDHFKQINDAHGHGAGDEVLKAAAERMRSAIRRYDAIGRYGGEEFLLVLPNCPAPDALDVVERARRAVGAAAIDAAGSPLEVSISAGVAWTNGTTDSAAIVHAADEALYRAKEGGRNRVEGKEIGGFQGS